MVKPNANRVNHFETSRIHLSVACACKLTLLLICILETEPAIRKQKHPTDGDELEI